jgi:hypothetical protein
LSQGEHLSRDAECGGEGLRQSSGPVSSGNGIRTKSPRSEGTGILKHVTVAVTLFVSLIVVGVLYTDSKQTVSGSVTHLSTSGRASTSRKNLKQTARKSDYSGKYAR